jgi:diacylglycerol kinase (ATP)
MRLVWIVHNPAAGRFPSNTLVRRAASVFNSRGWTVHTETARQRDHLKDLVRLSVEASAEALIVAGGDGTVGLAASLLRGSPTALGVIPTGTANVWARELGVPKLNWARPRSVERLAERLAEGTIRRVDLGEANGRAFLLWAGTGLDARVVNLVEPRRRVDKILPTTLYIIHTLRSARGWEGVDLEVVWPGGCVVGKYLLAVASNVRSYGGGLLRLAPMARVDDGLLDFWILKGHSIGDTVWRLLQIMRGVHLTSDDFIHFQASEAEFRAAGSLPMHFDGEPGSLQSPIRMKALPEELGVLLPRGNEEGLFQSTQPAAAKVS